MIREVVIENPAVLTVGNGGLEPVLQKGVLRVAEREIGHKAEGPDLPDDLGDPLALGFPLAPFEDDAVGSDLPGAGEVVDPLAIVGWEEGLQVKRELNPAVVPSPKGLVGIEVVSQKGDPPRSIMGSPGVDPAGGGPDLAVLFFPAVLPDDELRRKGHDPGLSGDPQGRGPRDMTLLDTPVRSVGDMTGRNRNSRSPRRMCRFRSETYSFRDNSLRKDCSPTIPMRGESSFGGTTSRMFRIWTSVGTSCAPKRDWTLFRPVVRSGFLWNAK